MRSRGWAGQCEIIWTANRKLQKCSNRARRDSAKKSALYLPTPKVYWEQSGRRRQLERNPYVNHRSPTMRAVTKAACGKNMPTANPVRTRDCRHRCWRPGQRCRCVPMGAAWYCWGDGGRNLYRGALDPTMCAQRRYQTVKLQKCWAPEAARQTTTPVSLQLPRRKYVQQPDNLRTETASHA